MTSRVLSRPAIPVPDKVTIAITFFFLILVFLTGGSSRADVQSLLILRPLAIIVIAAMVFIMTAEDWAIAKKPLLMLGSLALLIAFQLVPLPHSIWSALPGREIVVESDNAAGLGQIWRPFTLSPSGSWNALMGLLVPLVAILVSARMSRFAHWGQLPFFLAVLTLSAAIGFLQIGSGHDSPLYLYDSTSQGRASGLLANSNHHAYLMATTLPMLALWSRLRSSNAQLNRVKPGFSAVLALFIILGAVATGSRGGMIAIGLAIICSILVLRMPIDPRYLPDSRSLAKSNKYVVLGCLGFLVLGLLISVAFQPVGLQRILTADVADDLRLQVLPTTAAMVEKYAPWGAGFGSFDRLFRIDEPMDVLSYVFLNHAHNDLIEFLIEGGILSLAVLLWLLISLGAHIIRLWRARAPINLNVAYGRLATIICGLLLMSSLLDYALRIPAVMVIFVFAYMWILTASRNLRRHSAPEHQA